MSDVNDMIKLELRGKAFIVSKDVLINIPGTYFFGLLSSSVWQPNDNGVYVIDRPHEGLDRILEYLETGELSCEGLTEYEVECVYSNLDYFNIPHTRVWNYSNKSSSGRCALRLFLQLNDGRLCGRSGDNSVCVWDIDTDTIDTCLRGHTECIRDMIQLEDGRICSCSNDNTIKVWNIESNRCDLTISGHTNSVYCILQLSDGRLCSASFDKTIKFWNIENGECSLSIHGENGEFCLVKLHGSRICGDYYGSIKLWNVDTGVCEMTLSGTYCQINSITVIDEVRICSCSSDKTIKIWNTSSGICERTMIGHTHSVKAAILLLDGRICSVSVDGSMRIWNVETGVCDVATHVSSSGLWRVIQLHDGRLVVSDYLKYVHVLG